MPRPARTASQTILVYLISLTAIFLWGMSYIWNDSLIGRGIPVEYFVWVRVMVAGSLLLAFNLLTRASVRIVGRDIWWFLLLALFEPTIYFVCETYGIKLTESPTYSALIIASTPIVALAVGPLIFKEKVSILNIVGVAVCIGGLAMVTLCASSVGEHFLLGVVLLVVAVLAEVAHASVVNVLARRYRPSVIVMYQFLMGGAMLLPVFLTKGIKDFEPGLYLGWGTWAPILCLAVLCSSLAFTLWASSIKHLGVTKSSIFLAMIPVVTAVAGWLLGNEILSGKQWIGIGIFCGGLVLSQCVVRRRC